MNVLILSFYYTPDLCAGSFRTSALVEALYDQLPEGSHVEVITTLPNRYSSFSSDAPELEESPFLTVRRVKLPSHQIGMVDQAKAYFAYVRFVVKRVKKSRSQYDLVFGTSSRLMTAALSAFVARWKKVPLFLDIRDIFVDTIKDVLSSKMALIVKPLFSCLEKWTILSADHVNLVSGGFEDYFKARYPKKSFSYFTNGIDAEFLLKNNNISNPFDESLPVVLYAGNIGEGQGLHKIIPELAKRYSGRLVFYLIGDGSRRKQLEERLAEGKCNNVKLLEPVSRDRLLELYQQADILFLHLNDYDAFRKVLPSKLFEYGAMGKPIWAGVSGYAANFVIEEISNANVFAPCDTDEAEKAFKTLKLIKIERDKFCQKFSRSKIMSQMTGCMIDVCTKKMEGRI